MKIFSADKFKESMGKAFNINFTDIEELWANGCDGQPVENGWVISTDGNIYFSNDLWEIESEEKQ